MTALAEAMDASLADGAPCAEGLRRLAQVLMETGQEVLDVDMANRAAGVVRALMKSWAETLPRCLEEVETVHSVIALMEAAGVDTQKQLTSETSRLSSLCSLKTALENYQPLGVTTGQRAQADPPWTGGQEPAATGQRHRKSPRQLPRGAGGPGCGRVPRGVQMPSGRSR
jgi:hypothetical protein